MIIMHRVSSCTVSSCTSCVLMHSVLFMPVLYYTVVVSGCPKDQGCIFSPPT